jgi:adenosylcobinamide-phosphate synthase
MHQTLALTAAALLVEAAFGYPQPIFRAIRHPVVWIGALIAALDRRMPRTRAAGLLALALILAATALPAILIQATASLLLAAILASSPRRRQPYRRPRPRSPR